MKIRKIFLACGLLSTLYIPSLKAETIILIDTDAPGAIINKNIYGQFMEHLGRGIYEGIWVGEDSSIENINGYRTDVVEALKDLHVPLLRWPGGCFADEYHWRDGIGPRENRKVTVNTNWGGVTDDNAFGTHEFFEFAEMLGAEVYINGNLGTGTPQEMAEWLEYMTSDSQSTLANLRRENGREEPWQVEYFAIGNESWGCGGSMTPEYYTNLYKHYSTFLKTPEDNTPILIASGGHTDLLEWTDYLIQNVRTVSNVRMEAISHHYYTLPSGDWSIDKGAALGFGEEEWFSTLQQTMRMEEFLVNNIAIMDEHDPEQEVGLYIDEWGTWFDPAEGDDPGFLYQQNSLRDAIVAALNLNLFHEYADRVHMSNIAQMVNVLQAMILTDKERMVLTPTYHLFQMYIPFQDARSVPVTIEGDPGYQYGGSSIAKISASAGIAQDGKLYLALVNTDAVESEEIVVQVPEGLQSANGEILSHDSMDAHNTFSQTEELVPQPFNAELENGLVTLNLPAKSVVVLMLE